MTATPNHALQRTAPRVTVAAISSSDPSRPCVALSHARYRFLRPTTQLPRHAPPSLSLGSLGRTTHLDQMNQLCERCHEREAKVFAVIVRGEQHTEQHLCESCYEDSTKDLPGDVPTAGWTSYGPNPGDTKFDER